MLVFYPADFSPVCTDQLSVYQEVLGELEQPRRAAARHLGRLRVLPQGLPASTSNLTIPLLADFHPKGEVAKAYGVWSRSTASPGARW